jgi:hypothetical protein
MSHRDTRIEGQGTTGNTELAMQLQDTRHWPQKQHDITPVTAEAELTTESAQKTTPPTPEEDTREATSSTQTADANASDAEGTPRQPRRAQTHGEHSDQYECEGSVEALAAAPSIAEGPATMTENSTTLSDEDMHRPTYVDSSKRKKSHGWGGRECLSVKGRGARRGVLNSTRNRYGRAELYTTTIPYTVYTRLPPSISMGYQQTRVYGCSKGSYIRITLI